MKKQLHLFLFGTFLCILSSFAQPPGEWTWISGDNITGQATVFGVQGVPNPANKPGAIYEGCEWVDPAGNFYFYGGLDFGFFTQADLWKYNPVTNEWTWLNGPGGTGGAPVHGTLGVASPTVQPGDRGYGMLSWYLNDELWMFGGYSNTTVTYYADFWKYNLSTNMWTWMGGDTLPGTVGHHGTMGVPSLANMPPPSTENACTWVEGDNLWFYGGMSQNGPYIGDMWRYNTSSAEWTWMKGDTTYGAAPIYGTLGVSSPTNFPGARICYSRWKASNGDFWIFGGSGSGGTYNDLWRYSVATNEWTWMNGPNVAMDAGSYGVQCVEAPTNRPPSRTEARAAWTDACGVFWLFGGSSTIGWCNDLWRFDPSSDMWTWVSGSSLGNAPGVYGIKGVSDPANVPGARQGSHAYYDISGNLWMFAGYAQAGAMINDLWRYVPDPSCGACSLVPIALFTAPNHICPGTCTDFNNISISATSFIWSFPGASPNVSTDVNPTGICYNAPGVYSVTLIASNANTSDTLTLNNYITVYPYPPPQGITQSGDTLFANQGAVSYQWYYNGTLINGATDYFYVAQASGNYNVVCTDLNDCEVEAVIFDVVASVKEGPEQAIILFDPNPTDGVIRLRETGKVSLYDSLWKLLFEKIVSQKNTELDFSQLSRGVYLIQLEQDGRAYQHKLVKM